MTNPEYIRISAPERHYGRKHFLQAQLNMLNSMKHHTEYEKLRKEELLLKLQLKKLIEDAQNSARVLDALLPRIKVHTPEQRETREELNELEAEERSIEQEIDEVKKRLMRLG